MGLYKHGPAHIPSSRMLLCNRWFIKRSLQHNYRVDQTQHTRAELKRGNASLTDLMGPYDAQARWAFFEIQTTGFANMMQRWLHHGAR